MTTPLPRVALRKYCKMLTTGAVIAYPTETVFGLGCDPWQPAAVARILMLKQRPVRKGLILVAGEFAQLLPLIQLPGEARLKKILATWPGPNTWVFRAQAWLPNWLTGDHASIAVRVSSHRVVQQLCLAFGAPLVSTSANVSGRPVARNAHVLRRQFFSSVDAIIPGQPGQGTPSRIRDALSGQILR